MLGGFNSVKRENHHYKYAHCETINDLKTVNQNYKNDFPNNEKCFNWNMDSYVHDGSSNLFGAESTIITFDTLLPKTTNAKNLFNLTSTLNFVRTDFSNFSTVNGIFGSTKLKEIPENFYPNTTVLNDIFSGGKLGFADDDTTVQVTIPYHETINNATSLYEAFWGGEIGSTWWFRTTMLDERYTFPNVVNAVACFENHWPYTSTGMRGEYTLNLSKLQNGDRMFNGSLRLSRVLTPLSSLTSGNNMFQYCMLDKSSVLMYADTLPTYTTGTHYLTLGIFKGYQHDPEMADALQRIRDKGWTLTVQWNNIPDSNPWSSHDVPSPPSEWPFNEIICPIIYEKLEMDVIKLPYGYQRCVYLEDTGTQFIDTEVKPGNDIGAWNIIQQYKVVDGNAMGAGNNNQSFYTPRWANYRHTVYYGWGTEVSMGFKGISSTGLTSINWLNDKQVMVNRGHEDVTYVDITDYNFNITLSITLFKRNGSTPRQWNGRIYRAKISEGDQIIRDFIPALDPDGKPCMYEMIEGKTYYNAATSGDDFLYKVYEDYVMPELPPYDIVEGSKYIPDASSWNEEVYTELTEKDIKIVRVVNGIAYDE